MFYKLVLSIFLVGVLGACAINKNIVPLEKPEAIKNICIKENPKILMKEGFLPELESQLHSHGIKTSIFTNKIPSDCRYTLEYTANWQWDMAMYLTYMHIEIRDAGNVIGSVEYDARRGGGNMNKFGHTSEKMRPLLDEMLGEIKLQ